jgi:serine phosphatase RsbU (regulator of sigma subunit)
LFVTMAVTWIDTHSGSLMWANAGHPSAYVFDQAGRIKTELESTGLPLGVLADKPRMPAMSSSGVTGSSRS